MRLGTATPTFRLGTVTPSRIYLGATQVWPTGGTDPDAADYFARIVAAGSTISSANQAAVNTLVVGCKTDGIWTAIKASCLLAGADTLAGALVPLVGSAPTNNNFVSGDYSRTTGLQGGTSRRLNTNRLDSADPQDNCHAAVWVTNTGSGTSVGIIGSNSSTAIAQRRFHRNSMTCNDITSTSYTIATGFLGMTRASSTNYTRRVSQTNATITVTSTGTSGANVAVFARDTAGASVWAGRASFYSLGGSLDLALLDARLATYMSSLT